MTSILTNEIEANSFLGLVSNAQKKKSRKIFVKVESREVLRNLAIATVVIVMGLTVGAISQKKIELAQYVAPITKAAV